MVLLPAALCLLFLLALTLSCLIPSAAIERNCRKSAAVLLPLGGYPHAFGIPSKAFQLDHFTDSIMLNVAYTVDARQPLRSALADSLRQSALDSTLLLGSLVSASSRISHGWSYVRYWHGYLVYLRPLLVLLDRRQILLVLGVILALVTGLLVLTLWKADASLAVAILLSLLLTNVLVVVQSLQFVQTYVLAMALSLFVARTHRRSDTFQIATFSVAGALTAFIDVLATPVVTLGIPLLVLVHGLRSQHRLTRFREGPRRVLDCSIAWLFAYGACWAGKWILASALLRQDVIADGLGRLALRTSAQGTNVSRMLDSLVGFTVPGRISAPLLNVAALMEWDDPQRLRVNVALYGLALAAAGLLALRFRKRRVDGWFLALLVTIAAGPYLWYAGAAQHSNRHYWYAYRNQVVTMIALGCAWWHLVDGDALRAALRRWAPGAGASAARGPARPGGGAAG
jgi:hypothetical protein